MMRNVRRLVSLVVCAAMLAPLLNGCAKSPVDTAIATLASGGVAVYDDYGGRIVRPISGTPSAMRLTRWQLSNMVAQADAHMGMLGSDIDAYERGKAPKNAPTFSYFMAAWVQRGEGPLAQYAQQLMGTQNWHQAPHITYSMLVITMFIADAARMPAHTAAAPSANGYGWERMIAAPAQADGICSSVSDFVSSVVADVENALSVNSGGFFSTLWNVAVKLVSGLAEIVIGGILTPLLSILNAVAGGLAAISAIASTLKPWTVNVVGSPAQVTIGEAPVDGQFTATLNAQAIDWPAQVADCASALGGIDLTKISYADAPVTWKTLGSIPGLASVTSKDDKIDNNKQATLHFQSISAQAPSDANCTSQQTVGQGGAQVTVERVDVEHLEQALTNLAFSKLPAVVRTNLAPLLQPVMSSTESQLAQLVATAPTGSGYVTFVEMKAAPNCTPTPSPSPSTTPQSQFGANDLLGNWKCAFSVGRASGYILVSSPSIGTSNNTPVVNGGTGASFPTHWTYQVTGPKSGIVSVIAPTLIPKAEEGAALTGRPLTAAQLGPHASPVTWLNHDHRLLNGYDCTRM